MIHPSAIVESDLIGSDTQIWHFCHVRKGAQIGRSCMLGQAVYVAPSVIIGNHCRIQNQVSLFDGVILEDHVFVGPSVVFTNVLRPRAFLSQRDHFLETRLEKGASVGANATVLCGTVIGAFALVAASSVVTRNVPPHALVLGAPATQVGWVCYCGTTLENDVDRDPSSDPLTQIQHLRCPQCGSNAQILNPRSSTPTIAIQPSKKLLDSLRTPIFS